jgi:hypothetical protein
MAKKKELVKKIEALRVAEMIGCRGAHKDKDGNWMPCASMESLERISNRAETSKWKEKSAPDGTMQRDEVGRKKRRKRRDGWEKLRERPIQGINGSGPGITSGPSQFAAPQDVGSAVSSGSAVSGGSTMNMFGASMAKAAMTGPEYVRDNDPDVFTDPESARARSRQMGCIGVSRRISKTGRAVWMPCTNMSDYARLAGSTALGRRGRAAQERNAIRTVLREELGKLKRKKSIQEELTED